MLVGPVAQGIQPRLLQLRHHHAPPGGLPGVPKGPAQVGPLKGKQLARSPGRLPKGVLHGRVKLPGLGIAGIGQVADQGLQAVDADFAAVDGFQMVETAQKRALARTAAADDGNDLAPVHTHGYAL